MTKTVLVQDFMTKSPHSIGVELSVGDAKKIMRAYKIRHLPVLDGGNLVGVVSDRDVRMIEAVSQGQKLSEIPIEEAMSQAVYTVSPTMPLQVCARHMSSHLLGSAVVMKGSRVVGVFTTTDALAALAQILDAMDEKPMKLAALVHPGVSAIVRQPKGTLLKPERR